MMTKDCFSLMNAYAQNVDDDKQVKRVRILPVLLLVVVTLVRVALQSL